MVRERLRLRGVARKGLGSSRGDPFKKQSHRDSQRHITEPHRERFWKALHSCGLLCVSVTCLCESLCDCSPARCGRDEPYSPRSTLARTNSAATTSTHDNRQSHQIP